jgi:hypothetical protein
MSSVSPNSGWANLGSGGSAYDLGIVVDSGGHIYRAFYRTQQAMREELATRIFEND